jgi:hypothetical protein
MNFIENSIGLNKVKKSTWISDLTIVCDKTVTPPIIAACQYFGTDHKMTGDARSFPPIVIYMIDFVLGEPHVFICPTHQPSSFLSQTLEKIKCEIDEKSPNSYISNILNFHESIDDAIWARQVGFFVFYSSD